MNGKPRFEQPEWVRAVRYAVEKKFFLGTTISGPCIPKEQRCGMQAKIRGNRLQKLQRTQLLHFGGLAQRVIPSMLLHRFWSLLGAQDAPIAVERRFSRVSMT
jgi:hypothetical protein